MNLNNLSIQGLSEALAWTLLHSVWQAIIIASMLAIVLHFTNKNDTKLRYSLASIGMLLIFMSAALTFFLALPDKVLMGSYTYDNHSFELAKSTGNSLSGTWLKDLLPTQVLFPILLRSWLVGVVLLTLRMIINYVQALRLKKSKIFHLNHEHLSIANNLLKRFKISKKVVFRESALVDSPSLVGYFKPVILLPVSLISGIPNNQLEIIIAHELAHIHRHDYLVQFIQGIIEILFFYHPVVWWLSSVVNIEREHICDDLAIKVCGESLPLIKALNNMENIRKKKPELVLNFSGKKGNLLHRVRRIINPETVKHPRLERGLLSILFVFVLSSMILFSNLANSKNQTQLEPMHLTNFTVGNFHNNEIPQASPINLKKKKKKVKENQIISAPPKIVKPIKPEEVIAPEIPELPALPIILSDTIEVKEVVEVQKEALEEALKELENVKIEINEESIKELEESLKELESVDIYIEKTIIDVETDLEKAFNTIGKENGEDLSENEKNELKTKFRRIQSGELHKTIKENLTRSRESLQRQLEKMKSGEFQKYIEIQKAKIKEMIEKFESPEFQKNLKVNLEKSREHIRERLKEIESPEFQKELKEKAKKAKKKKSKRNRLVKAKGKTNNPPLFVIDGSIMKKSMNMDDINSDDIKSINVLKGDVAIEKYGKKAENGVIEITTKK